MSGHVLFRDHWILSLFYETKSINSPHSEFRKMLATTWIQYMYPGTEIILLLTFPHSSHRFTSTSGWKFTLVILTFLSTVIRQCKHIRIFHIQINNNSKIPTESQGHCHFAVFKYKTLLGLRIFGKYKLRNKSEILTVP